MKKLFSFVLFIVICFQFNSVNASTIAGIISWKLPLSKGSYLIINKDQAHGGHFCNTDLCIQARYNDTNRDQCAIDIIGDGKNIGGTPILAPANGKVLSNGVDNFGNSYVYIKHDDGSISGYFHLNIGVKNNQVINTGDQIGTVGNNGISSGAHLHFFVLKNDIAYAKRYEGGCVSLSGLEGYQWDSNKITSSNKVDDTSTDPINPIVVQPQPPLPSNTPPPPDNTNSGGSCSASTIDAYINGSPLEGKGNVFISEGEKSNVDPRFIVAIAFAESSLGRNPCGSGSNNAWGELDTDGKCKRFSSWEDGIAFVSNHIGKYYLPKGQDAINEFVKTPWGVCTSHCYCASGCENWISNVSKAYSTMGGTPQSSGLSFSGCSGGQTTSNTRPNRPSIENPTDWAVTKRSEVQLCAKENGDPDSGDGIAEYQFQIIDSASNWDSGWVNSSCANTPSLEPFNYQWHVRVRDTHQAESEWSDSVHFTVEKRITDTPVPQNSSPSIPTLSQPGNGKAYSQDDDVWLSWNYADNATEYYLEYWGGPYNTLNSGWINDVAYHIGSMWPGTYSWHVKARNQDKESGWSEMREFKINENQVDIPTITPTTPPVVQLYAPNLSSPGNNQSLDRRTQIILKWDGSGASSFLVELWGGPYDRMVPCNWTSSTSCSIGEMWPGTMSWHVKGRDNSGRESDWSQTWNFTINDEAPTQVPPTSVPQPQSQGFLELVDNLGIRAENNSWPPNSGQKLIAHIKIRNGGDLPINILHVGVRGRRNGSESWDIGFWQVNLGGHQEWSLDPNNERPLSPGKYSFRISYQLDGGDWTEIGNEITFTVP